MQLMWKCAMSPQRGKNWSMRDCMSSLVFSHPWPRACTCATSSTGRTPSTSSMTFAISSRVPNCPSLPMVSMPRITSLIPSSSRTSLHFCIPAMTLGSAVSGDFP